MTPVFDVRFSQVLGIFLPGGVLLLGVLWALSMCIPGSEVIQVGIFTILSFFLGLMLEGVRHSTFAILVKVKLLPHAPIRDLGEDTRERIEWVYDKYTSLYKCYANTGLALLMIWRLKAGFAIVFMPLIVLCFVSAYMIYVNATLAQNVGEIAARKLK